MGKQTYNFIYLFRLASLLEMTAQAVGTLEWTLTTTKTSTCSLPVGVTDSDYHLSG